MGLAAILLTAAGHESLTIAAAVIMGLLGTLFLIVLQAALSDHHGAGRAIAFTESNVGASRITSYNVCYTKLLRASKSS